MSISADAVISERSILRKTSKTTIPKPEFLKTRSSGTH